MSFCLVSGMDINLANIATYSVVQDVTVFDTNTSYSSGDIVVLDEFGLVQYESLEDNNQNNQPSLSSLKWNKKQLPSNRAGMFDERVGTFTTATGSISITIDTVGFQDTVSLLGMNNIKEVKVSSLKNGVEMWSKTMTIFQRQVTSLCDIFFAEFKHKESILFTDLPRVRNQQIKIEITGGAGAEIKVGSLIIGKQKLRYKVAWSFTSPIKSYSVIEVKKGITSFKSKHPTVKTTEGKLRIPADQVFHFNKTISEHDGKPSLWILASEYQETIVYGVMKSSKPTTKNSRFATVQVSILGVG